MNSDNRLFCRLDGLSAAAREHQRKVTMAQLGLLSLESVPVFEEATQIAARLLDMPICMLSIMESDHQRFRSAVGLSHLGLMNELAAFRQLPRGESFCTHVVDSQQILVISDTLSHPAFANSLLTQQYGVRAYLGVPLVTSRGCCIGTLALMDLVPRIFNQRDIEFVQLTARWSMSEFERQDAHKQAAEPTPVAEQPCIVQYPEISPASSSEAKPLQIAQQLRVELLSQLTQELRTPLTSVMGMASVLNREIYGPLTNKQKEYLDIIHRSGQYLLSLVNEILELSEVKDSIQKLNPTSVDVEMLCQQAINTLEQAAQRREQEIRLTVEPGPRVWSLDKGKVRQMLYHLVFDVIQSSTAGSIIRLHVSRKANNLNIAIWVSHPWLGEGMPYAEIFSPSLVSVGALTDTDTDDSPYYAELDGDNSADGFRLGRSPVNLHRSSQNGPTQATIDQLSHNLGLSLCRQLAELHGGTLITQGVLETGQRYVISLPPRDGANESAP